MNHAVNNFLIEDYVAVKSKSIQLGNKLKLFAVAYGIWIVISIMLAYMQPHKYASYFTDLPQSLKNVPSFVLSIVYLNLFIPAIALVILFAFYILFIVIRNAYMK